MIWGDGVADRLAEVVQRFRPSRVLVVGSERGIARARVRERLGDRRVQVFAGFRPNPTLTDVLAGCGVLRSIAADLVIGVGGGSAMDTAKMVRLLPPDRPGALAMLAGAAVPDDRVPPPLVVLPTTAGTGSEVTRFATVYVEGRKHSLDTAAARPDVALVDPQLTATCPPELTLSCGFDALTHALESYWSLRSTSESRGLAESAGRGLAVELAAGRAGPDRSRLSTLALQAGRAIDRTRTTVGHAFAYPLTVRYGIPHGLAAALALAALLPPATGGAAPCRDPRGPDFVADRLAGLAGMLGVADATDLGPALGDLIAGAGFAPRLRSYGVRVPDLAVVTEEALGSSRSGNAPVDYPPEIAVAALRAAW